MEKKERRRKTRSKLKKYIFALCVVLLICALAYLAFYLYNKYKTTQDITEVQDDIKVEGDNEVNRESRIDKLKKLKEENSDIIGWLEIEDTNINYPVLQCSDNDFYLNHNYKKEYSSAGSLFLDKDFDMENGSSNYLIYGHRNESGIMFEDLLKYADEEFYKSHTKIRFTTLEEDYEYEVLAVFYSRVYYKREKNVFRYYYFVNAESKEEYDDFVLNAKKASIYDTGVSAEYGDQLLTLSTCEYSQEDGRFAVVFKKAEKFEEK